MADDTRSSREIERELEQERAELRNTVDQLLGRLTFEDAWERTGRYLRENRSEYGHTLGRMVREKPVALAITAIGIGWLLFGPATPAPRGRERGAAHPQRLPEADRDPYSNQPPPRPDPAEKLPRASEVREAQRTTPPPGAGSAHRDSSATGAAAHPGPSSSTASSDPSGPARSASADPGRTGTSTSGAAATAASRTGPTSTEGEAARDRPPGTPPTGSAATSTSHGAGLAGSNQARDPAKPGPTPTSSPAGVRPSSGTGTSDGERDEDRSK